MKKLFPLEKDFFKKIILFACLAATPWLAFGQSKGIPDQLSLDQAVQLFLQNNPQLLQSCAAAERIIQEAKILTLWPNPSLSIDQEQEDAGASQTLLLDQSVLNPVEYAARRKSAKAQKKAALSGYDENASQLYLILREKYIQVVSAKAKVELLAGVTGTVRRAIEILRIRQQEGDVGSFEVKRLSTALANYENRLGQARVENQAARQDLILFIKPNADTTSAMMDSTLVLTDSLAYRPVQYTYSELLQTAFQQRGLLASIQSFEQAGRLNLRAEKAARLPDLSISGSLNHKPGLQPQYYPFLGIGIEIPLWNNNGPQIRAARARFHEFQAGVDIARRRVELEVRTAFNRVQSYRKRMEEINGDILQKNKGLLEDALFLYSEGQLTLVELLDAASAALDARLLHIDLLTRYNLSRYQLEQAVGQLPPGFEAPDS